MMDYSKLSDFEINKRVLAIKSGIKPLGYAHNADDRSAGIVDVSKNYQWFDFCNNAADAWPIIADKKICLAFDVFAEPQDGGGWVSSPSYGWETERVRHDNPLRAAMIVFLKMQESE